MSVANGNKKRELEKNDATDASAEPIAKKKCCWNYRITVEPLGFLYLTAGIVQVTFISSDFRHGLVRSHENILIYNFTFENSRSSPPTYTCIKSVR